MLLYSIKDIGMTHAELEYELVSLERKIEVLELLIHKPQCSCFRHNNTQFTTSNVEDLNLYKERRQYLLSVKNMSI